MLRFCNWGILSFSLILSWVLKQFKWLNDSNTTLPDKWYHIQAVLHISFGNFLFFAILALLMIRLKDQNNRRDSWHHRDRTAKLLILVLPVAALMFFLANAVLEVYEIISKFGADLFLLVFQAMILFDATDSWEDPSADRVMQKCYLASLAVVACSIGAATLSGILFIWFNPSTSDCGLNITFILMTMILPFAFAIIALHPKVKESLLPVSAMSIYCACVWCTDLSSEPRDYTCNDLLNKSARVTTGTLFLGMLTTVFTALYAELSLQQPFFSRLLHPDQVTGNTTINDGFYFRPLSRA